MLQLRKEEREKQNGLKTKVYLIGSFCFAGQDAIEFMIGFKIDNRTIKREIFNYNGYLVPLSVSPICIYIALSDVVRCVRKAQEFSL